MVGPIPSTRAAVAEALELSADILKNIELSEIPLSNIALKSARLARLLNDSVYEEIFQYESGGYPTTPDGVPPKIFELATLAGRQYSERDSRTKKISDYVYLQSINQMEETLRISENALLAARDPDDSAAPRPFEIKGNSLERRGIRNDHEQAANRLSKSKALIYRYTLQRHYELRFSGIADDVFTRIRLRVDGAVGAIVPDAVKKLAAIYDNLSSESSEDWSNAAHGCRRLLQELADVVFPATDSERRKAVDGRTIVIKLGAENYINRLLAFVEDKSDSSRFNEIVGSHLGFLGDRLDAVFRAAQKGSHSNILSKEEADRYVVYTYLVVGDILSLVGG